MKHTVRPTTKPPGSVGAVRPVAAAPAPLAPPSLAAGASAGAGVGSAAARLAPTFAAEAEHDARGNARNPAICAAAAAAAVVVTAAAVVVAVCASSSTRVPRAAITTSPCRIAEAARAASAAGRDSRGNFRIAAVCFSAAAAMRAAANFAAAVRAAAPRAAVTAATAERDSRVQSSPTPRRRRGSRPEAPSSFT